MKNIPVELNNLDFNIAKAKALREDLTKVARTHGVDSSEYDRQYEMTVGTLRTKLNEILDVWIKHLQGRRDQLLQTT